MKNYSIAALVLLLPVIASADLLFPLRENRQKFKISGHKHKEKMSQSFIFPRPVYRNIEAREFLAHEFFADKNCNGTGFQVVGLYQQARSSKKVGRYFAINHKNLLTVKGDNVVPINRDVRAEWLDLDSDFNGCMQLTPEQRQWAAYFELQQDFKRFTDNYWLSSLYVSVAIPVQHVKNNMNFEQFISVPSQSPGPTDLKQAFNRCSLKNAKIPTESQTKTSIPEIIFRLGAYFLKDDGYELGVYSLLHVPTSQKAQAEFLFDPFLGHNDHWGYGTGVNIQIPLNCSTDKRIIAFYADLEHLFLFRGTQDRTLDIREKPWSRYLLLNQTNGQRNIPAANVLTRRVRVEPFSMFDGSGGFRLYNEHVAFEFGYSVWAHGTEYLRLKERWENDFGIAGQEPDPEGRPLPVVNCVPVGPTASKSTISCREANDVDDQGNLKFVPIRFRDLDFFSGGARAAVVHRAHVATGFKVDHENLSFFAGLGAYGQFPNLNTAFSAWGMWGKFGFTF